MKYKIVLLMSASFLFTTACSNKTNSPTANTEAHEPKPNSGFQVVINAKDCKDPWLMSELSAGEYKTTFWRHVRYGDAACVKKSIELGHIDVNKALSGDSSKKQFPIFLALDEKSISEIKDKAESFWVVKVLFEAGADLSATNGDGDTPLLLALKQKNQSLYGQVAEYLLQTGAGDVNHLDQNGNSAIHFIIDAKKLNSLRSVIKGHADLNLEDSSGRSPIVLAVEQNWEEGALLLAQSGADINVDSPHQQGLLLSAMKRKMTSLSLFLIKKMTKKMLQTSDSLGRTPLVWAILNKDTILTQALLDRNVAVNLADSRGYTPLLLATEQDFTDGVRLLLSQKADVDSVNFNGDSVLHLAKSQPVADLLLAHKAPLNILNKRGETAVAVALQNSRERVFIDLFNAGVNLDWQGPSGESLLHLAVSKNLVPSAELLLTQLDVNSLNSVGQTPIYLVNNIGLLKKMLSHHPDLENTDINGDTPLTWQTKLYLNSERRETLGFIKALLEAGSNINHVYQNGQSILYEVVNKENALGTRFFADLLDLFSHFEIDWNQCNSAGESLLFYVDTAEEVQWLKSGNTQGHIDIELKSSAGLTALETFELQLQKSEKEIQSLQKEIDNLTEAIAEAKKAGALPLVAILEVERQGKVVEKQSHQAQQNQLQALIKAILS